MTQKIALVTGGLGGIGCCTAQHLTELGFKVAVADHSDQSKLDSWQAEQQQAGFDITPFQCDVSDIDSCNNMIANVENNVGPIDVLVNNAGITRDALVQDNPLDKWQEVLHTNLDSIFYLCSAVVNGMIERNYGRIINVSSLIAQKGRAGQTNYGAAKAGMHGFTKSLAHEVGQYGVTVNTVSPGYIETKMTATMKQEELNDIIAHTALRRMGKPEEIAWLIGFIASDKCGFITGTNFSINGGFHMY